MLTIIPTMKVYAKPLTALVPISYRIRAAISVVTCESIIVDIALFEPVSVATRTVLPSMISSRIRENMTTFASTAIPIEMMIPAIPGSVSTVPISDIIFKTSTT